MAFDHHNNLNLLRALAVLAVFAHHFEHYAHVPVPYLGTFGGQLGVQLFFLISGYLIVQTAARQTWHAFLVNRAFRLFPAYWAAVLAVSVFISHTLPLSQPADWPYFLANLMNLSHLNPYAMGRFDVLTVSWTLTIEWVWYLLVPVLLWGAHQAQRRGATDLRYWGGVTVVSLFVSVIWILLAQRGFFDFLYAGSMAKLGIDPINAHLRTAFIVVAAPAQGVFFMLGVMLWVARGPVARVPSWACAALALVLLVQPSWWPRLLGFDPSVATGVGLAALFVLANRMPANWSRTPPVRFGHWVGDLSYPMYLIHVPAIVVATVHAQLAGGAALLASLVLTLLAAALLHHAVENPGRHLGARVLRPRIIGAV